MPLAPPLRTSSLPAFLVVFLLTCCSASAQQGVQTPAHPPGMNAYMTHVKMIDSMQRMMRPVDWLRGRNDIRKNKPVLKTVPSHQQQRLQIKSIPLRALTNNPGQPLATVCYTISGRDFLKQDSLVLYTSDPILSADGNVIVAGEYGTYAPYYNDGGFCMKTDITGNVIWAKLYDSANSINYSFINFQKVLELRDGSILLAGRNENDISGNEDFVLSKLDANGNQLWFKTYASRFWEGFHGSGDYFELKSLVQDPATGEVYFAGSHWGGLGAVTKIDPADGQIIWSNGYRSYNTNRASGIIVNPAELLLFQVEYTSYNDNYINITSINKTNGDTIYRKKFYRTDDPYITGAMYNTDQVIKLANGHYRLSGMTTRFVEYPYVDGTSDRFHAAVAEFDNNLNFVKAWGFKNKIDANGENTKVSLFPDGTGVFTMLQWFSGYNGDAYISVFKDDLIYHQRKRIHRNEGMPYEPLFLQLPDGGYLNVKIIGDSTVTTHGSSKVDYYRMHSSDTASLCLGVRDSATSVWYANYVPSDYGGVVSIDQNVFSESHPQTITRWDFGTTTEPACQVISYCDTLSLSADTTKICAGRSITLSIHKNKECGSLVPLQYDSNFVNHVTKINDSTWSFLFTHAGKGYIKGSLLGCVLREDSIAIDVLPATVGINLGPDTVICPGNKMLLHAGPGFTMYQWQDGTADSVYTVESPGKYFVTAINGCGDSYSDTVIVSGHPPISISIGPDRSKCNNDTLKITATDGFINYKWLPDYNISSLTSPEVIVNPQTDTIYTIEAEKTPGCFAYDTVYIHVNKSLPVNIGQDTSVCKGDSLRLDAGAGFQSYQWSTGENTQVTYVKQPGFYWMNAIAANSCASSDTINLLQLYNLPSPDLGPDSSVCAGRYRILYTAGNFTAYSWSTGETTPSIQVDQPGYYRLSVTDRNGCSGSDSTYIPSVINPPTSFLGADTAICSYSNLFLQPKETFSGYQWNTGASSQTIKITVAGIYWLEVTDANNCKGKDTIIVNLKDCMTGLYVPAAFTPNGDGLNDMLRPMLFGNVQSFKFQLYNRWGEIVFQTNTPGTGWDGVYRGQKQDTDVFVWVCWYQLTANKQQKATGQVTLIR